MHAKLSQSTQTGYCLVGLGRFSRFISVNKLQQHYKHFGRERLKKITKTNWLFLHVVSGTIVVKACGNSVLLFAYVKDP